jgi:Icc-related predicted phosphoesterase
LFLYFTDLHGNFGELKDFISGCLIRYPSLQYLLVGGDVSRRPNLSEDWTRAKLGSILEAMEMLRGFNLKTFLILGNDDIENPEIPSKDWFHCMTNEVLQIAPDIGLLGFSYVPPTPFHTRYERDERTICELLDPLFKKLQSFEFKIVMCHAPPEGINLDLAVDWYPNGEQIKEHVGSKSVRRLISKYQPDLALFGHIHESTGVCRIGRTLCVNPGASNKEMRGCAFDRKMINGVGGFAGWNVLLKSV